jgi:hypothetical protein
MAGAEHIRQASLEFGRESGREGQSGRSETQKVFRQLISAYRGPGTQRESFPAVSISLVCENVLRVAQEVPLLLTQQSPMYSDLRMKQLPVNADWCWLRGWPRVAAVRSPGWRPNSTCPLFQAAGYYLVTPCISPIVSTQRNLWLGGCTLTSRSWGMMLGLSLCARPRRSSHSCCRHGRVGTSRGGVCFDACRSA